MWLNVVTALRLSQLDQLGGAQTALRHGSEASVTVYQFNLKTLCTWDRWQREMGSFPGTHDGGKCLYGQAELLPGGRLRDPEFGNSYKRGVCPKNAFWTNTYECRCLTAEEARAGNARAKTFQFTCGGVLVSIAAGLLLGSVLLDVSEKIAYLMRMSTPFPIVMSIVFFKLAGDRPLESFWQACGVYRGVEPSNLSPAAWPRIWRLN
jgi:hypothetical protein